MKKIYTPFIVFGPAIATSILVLLGHAEIYLYDPIRFLKGLIDPQIIFPMLGMMLFCLVFGYIFGILPALLTGRIFEKLIQPHLPTAGWTRFIWSGFCASMIWIIPALLIIFLHVDFWIAALCFVLFMSITSMLCAVISCRVHLRNNAQPTETDHSTVNARP